jgi:hypothetical protein
MFKRMGLISFLFVGGYSGAYCEELRSQEAINKLDKHLSEILASNEQGALLPGDQKVIFITPHDEKNGDSFGPGIYSTIKSNTELLSQDEVMVDVEQLCRPDFDKDPLKALVDSPKRRDRALSVQLYEKKKKKFKAYEKRMEGSLQSGEVKIASFKADGDAVSTILHYVGRQYKDADTCKRAIMDRLNQDKVVFIAGSVMTASDVLIYQDYETYYLGLKKGEAIAYGAAAGVVAASGGTLLYIGAPGAAFGGLPLLGTIVHMIAQAVQPVPEPKAKLEKAAIALMPSAIKAGREAIVVDDVDAQAVATNQAQ